MTPLLAHRLLALLSAPMLLAMADAPFGGTVRPLPPPELDAIRGGFLLPNGVDLAMTVQTDTAVDGHLVLRSVFRADQGPATLTVYAPAAGASGPAVQTHNGAGATGTAANPGVSVSIDRGSGIVSVQPATGSVGSGPNISVSGTNTPAAGGSDGLTQVTGDGPVAAAGGTVSVRTTPTGPLAEYTAPDLVVDHLFGRAFGSIVANTANDRSIDTVTSVNLDLHNATATLVGSSLLQAESLALDASRGMVR